MLFLHLVGTTIRLRNIKSTNTAQKYTIHAVREELCSPCLAAQQLSFAELLGSLWVWYFGDGYIVQLE